MAVIALIVGVFLTVPEYMLYTNVRDQVVADSEDQAKRIASTVARFVELDIVSYRRLSVVAQYTEGSYDRFYYEKMLRTLREIREDVGAAYVFTLKVLSDREVVYILDGTDTTSEDFSPLGSKDAITAAALEAYRTRSATSTGIQYYERWGRFVTGYAPIEDGVTDAVVGLVGVDYSADYLGALLRKVRIIILISLMVMIPVATFFVDKLLRLYTESQNRDYVTRLENQRSFHANIRRRIREAGGVFSLIMIDVDNFKNINDTHGHLMGDRALKLVADVIRESTRSGDMGFRYGGDEFCVLLPGVRSEDAVSTARRIQENASRRILRGKNGDLIPLSMSMGITDWSHGVSAKELLQQADDAMYSSKKGGKNQVSVYGERGVFPTAP